LPPRPPRQPRQPISSVDTTNATNSSSELDLDSLDDSGPEKAHEPLKAGTIRVYVAALAELYSTQVSMGLNRNPNFRGIALKGLLKDLSCKQETRACDNFEDHSASGIAAGYNAEEFLQMQDQLLFSAKSNPKVSCIRFYIEIIC
jgi:hypothetical protein